MCILSSYRLLFVVLTCNNHDSCQGIGVFLGALSHTYGARKLYSYWKCYLWKHKDWRKHIQTRPRESIMWKFRHWDVALVLKITVSNRFFTGFWERVCAFLMVLIRVGHVAVNREEKALMTSLDLRITGWLMKGNWCTIDNWRTLLSIFLACPAEDMSIKGSTCHVFHQHKVSIHFVGLRIYLRVDCAFTVSKNNWWGPQAECGAF